MESKSDLYTKIHALLELQEFLQVTDRDDNGNPLKVGNPDFKNNPDKKRLAKNNEDFQEIYNRGLNKIISPIIDIDSYIALCKEDVTKIIKRHKKIHNSKSHNHNQINTANSYLMFLDSKIPSKENESVEVKTVLQKDNNSHSKIFSNNGFELFQYILNNHVRPKGTTGRYADISHYYWKMYNSEIQYIHKRPEAFKEWFFETHDKENIGKIKTADSLKSIDRDKHYSNSLDWFKTQNK